VRAREPGYKLRPEAIESVFYMWRITGDQKWRDAAWRMWEGIVKATETQLAFASIENVAEQKSEKVDSMEVSPCVLQIFYHKMRSGS
jgi:mannosyl-oligosaccharide alpha-1,2-mannosidase